MEIRDLHLDVHFLAPTIGGFYTVYGGLYKSLYDDVNGFHVQDPSIKTDACRDNWIGDIWTSAGYFPQVPADTCGFHYRVRIPGNVITLGQGEGLKLTMNAATGPALGALAVAVNCRFHVTRVY